MLLKIYNDFGVFKWNELLKAMRKHVCIEDGPGVITVGNLIKSFSNFKITIDPKQVVILINAYKLKSESIVFNYEDHLHSEIKLDIIKTLKKLDRANKMFTTYDQINEEEYEEVDHKFIDFHGTTEK